MTRKVSLVLGILFIIHLFAATNLRAANPYPLDKKAVENVDKPAENSKTEKTFSWEFLSAVPSVLDKKAEKEGRKHELGTRVAYLRSLVNKYYVTKEEASAGDPMMRTVVRKPSIYFAINRLEKYLKQKVKQNEMTQEEASKKMEHILEVALAVIDSDEDKSFESTITDCKNNADKQFLVFDLVKLNNIYAER